MLPSACLRASIASGTNASARGDGRRPATCKPTVLLPLLSDRAGPPACDWPHTCAPTHRTIASAAVEPTRREWSSPVEAEAPEQERHRNVAGTAGPSIDLDLGANDGHANPAVAATGSSEAIDALSE